jgi:hypothetical protein
LAIVIILRASSDSGLRGDRNFAWGKSKRKPCSSVCGLDALGRTLRFPVRVLRSTTGRCVEARLQRCGTRECCLLRERTLERRERGLFLRFEHVSRGSLLQRVLRISHRYSRRGLPAQRCTLDLRAVSRSRAPVDDGHSHRRATLTGCMRLATLLRASRSVEPPTFSLSWGSGTRCFCSSLSSLFCK